MRQRIEQLLYLARRAADRFSYVFNATPLDRVSVWIRKSFARPLDGVLDRFPRFTTMPAEGVRVVRITRGDCYRYVAEVTFRQRGGVWELQDVLLRTKDEAYDGEEYVSSADLVAAGSTPSCQLNLNPAEADEVAKVLREAERFCRKPTIMEE